MMQHVFSHLLHCLKLIRILLGTQFLIVHWNNFRIITVTRNISFWCINIKFAVHANSGCKFSSFNQNLLSELYLKLNFILYMEVQSLTYQL